MAKTNIGGPAHKLLADSLKHVCEFCNGTFFQLVDTDSDENTNLPTDTKAYLWENSAPTPPHGNMQTLKLMCQSCGKISGKLIWCLDLCTARAASSITGTHIAAAVANGLAGLYVTVLGGTSVGVSYPISANSLADPTVMTITGTPAADAVGEMILLSSWKVF
jgi:hypothetical protein